MRKLNVIVRGCNFSRLDLEKLLIRMNVSLPVSMVEFYVLNSGQIYQECSFGNHMIRGWFNIKISECEQEQISMSFQEVFYHSRDFLANDLIPFAYNDMNDYYLISESGKVFFLRNDMAYTEEGALIQIADNFEELINGLH